jgi:hypothetical protein
VRNVAQERRMGGTPIAPISGSPPLPEGAAMPPDDPGRQQGGHRDTGAAPAAPSQFDAGRGQLGASGGRQAHVEPGHGEQRTYSPRGLAPDGTYIGRAGGYVGAAHDETDPGGGAQGEGTYGYAYGPGVGLRSARPHVIVQYGAEHPGFRRRGLGEVLQGWRTGRADTPAPDRQESPRERADGEDGAF